MDNFAILGIAHLDYCNNVPSDKQGIVIIKNHLKYVN